MIDVLAEGLKQWSLVMDHCKECCHSSNSKWFWVYIASFHCLPTSHWNADVFAGFQFMYCTVY